MSNRQIIFSNTFYQLMARIGTVFFTFLLSIVLTRQISIEFWGEYSVIMNYLALFYMLADFGINIVIVKDFAANEALLKEQFSKVFGFKLILGLVLSVIAVLSVNFLPYGLDVKAGIISGAILILLFSLQNAFQAIFQAKLEYWKSAVSNICTGFLTFLLVFEYITRSGAPLLTVVMGLTILGYLVGLGVSMFLTKSHVSYGIKSFFDWGFSKTLLNRSLFIGLTIVLNSFMFSGDKFLLSLFMGNFDVGVYTLAYKLFELYLVLPTFIMNSYYPSLIKLRLDSYEVVFQKVVKITLWMIPVWVVSCLAVWLTGVYTIPSIWGIDMIATLRPFSILMLTSLPFFITAPLTWIYYIENWNRRLLFIYLTGFIFNLLLNLYYIPLYGYNASAYITGLTEVFVLIMLLIGFNRSFRK